MRALVKTFKRISRISKLQNDKCFGRLKRFRKIEMEVRTRRANVAEAEDKEIFDKPQAAAKKIVPLEFGRNFNMLPGLN